jgi:hypothetical protein
MTLNRIAVAPIFNPWSQSSEFGAPIPVAPGRHKHKVEIAVEIAFLSARPSHHARL